MANPTASENLRPKTFKIKRLQIGLNVILQLFILTAIVIAVNYISFRHFKRWDFSRSQKFALSGQTRNLLASLPKPVKAIIFFNSASPAVGEVYSDVLGLLKEYEYASNQKLTVEIVDPYRSLTRAKDLAAQYKFGGNESILILDYDGRNKFINAQDLVEMDMGNSMMGMPPEIKAFKGESVVTSTLLELVEEKQKTVYLVGGHGEPDFASPEIASLREYVKRQNIKMEAVKLGDVDSVPENATGLLIFGPRADYSELETKRIADFWAKKGRLLVLLNPEAKTPRLNEWLSSVGITPRGDHVLKTGKVLGQGENGQPGLQDAIMLSPLGVIAAASKDVTHDIAGIDTQFLGSTESLSIENAQEQIQKLRFTTLVESGEGFWGESDYVRGENKRPYFDPKKDTQGPLVLGVAVEKGAMDDPRVKVDTGRMIVFGNADFLTDKGLQLSDVNIDLGLNSLNWLLNREQMLGGIAPKEKTKVALTLTEAQLRNLALTLMLGIPGVVAILGFLTWGSRRS
jgi:ABC-type uncharacterized transport system